jgi:hypothetical protein
MPRASYLLLPHQLLSYVSTTCQGGSSMRRAARCGPWISKQGIPCGGTATNQVRRLLRGVPPCLGCKPISHVALHTHKTYTHTHTHTRTADFGWSVVALSPVDGAVVVSSDWTVLTVDPSVGTLRSAFDVGRHNWTSCQGWDLTIQVRPCCGSVVGCCLVGGVGAVACNATDASTGLSDDATVHACFMVT